MPSRGEGTIITFYSYKGGVGRSFALANVASVLARWGYKLLCVDWDLEAPGLHYYFSTPKRAGILDMVREFANGGPLKWRKYVRKIYFPHKMARGSRIDFISSGGSKKGRADDQIAWEALYQNKNLGGQFELMRNQWREDYDFVLIDSRTGITDIGSICTVQLPDILVSLFTANRQSLDGGIAVAERARAERQKLPYDRASLLVLPILSRFDSREEYSIAERWKSIFAQEVGGFYDSWKHKRADVRKLIDATTIPYVSKWAFGEELAALLEGRSNPEFISYSLETLSGLISRKLADTDLLADSRDAYVDLARKGGLRKSGPTYDVYLSYSEKDNQTARKLLAALIGQGIRVTTNPSTKFMASGSTREFNKLLDELTRTRHLVAIVGTSLSEFQHSEIRAFLRETLDEEAGEQPRLLIPVLLEGASYRQLPSVVQRSQILRIRKGEDIRTIARSIARTIRNTQGL